MSSQLGIESAFKNIPPTSKECYCCASALYCNICFIKRYWKMFSHILPERKCISLRYNNIPQHKVDKL